LCYVEELIDGSAPCARGSGASSDWGIGHVQSVIGERVTVNFEERGKVVINTKVIDLEIVERKN